MYDIFGYFPKNNTCNTQSDKSDRESYQYTKRDYVTIYFNNTLASLDRSWESFKIDAYLTMYKIRTWLEKKYKSFTEQVKKYDFHAPTEKPPIIEEIEMKELNCAFRPFRTPPIHPASSDLDANNLKQIAVTQHAPQVTQQK
ncbi:WD_0964 family protein [Wolbachia endosymbiont of Tettigetta isshikii]|uniref:WD_0964 family protein n=1 Tax=Wolbachia endosymbiont of Tettigetta isshikii TaxID=3239093 RepID=UPI00398015C2